MPANAVILECWLPENFALEPKTTENKHRNIAIPREKVSEPDSVCYIGFLPLTGLVPPRLIASIKSNRKNHNVLVQIAKQFHRPVTQLLISGYGLISPNAALCLATSGVFEGSFNSFKQTCLALLE